MIMNSRGLCLTFITLLALALATGYASAGDTPFLEREAQIDTIVNDALARWKVPGAAIAVVKNGEVAFSTGYGVREAGGSKRIDENTLFAVASVTKSFTAAVIADLVAQGKVSWDDPVVEHLPSFRVYDAALTKQVTVRDLLAHRVGARRIDQHWYQSKASRTEVLARSIELHPAAPFRSRFTYNNSMYLAAGELAASISGKSWDELVQEKLFVPLGMNSSSTRSLDLTTTANRAIGYTLVEEKLSSEEPTDIDNCGPATSIVSNAHDMARWVQWQLARGQSNGESRLTETIHQEMHTPQIVVPPTTQLAKMFPDKQTLSYGLGWFVMSYRERTVIFHPGNAQGMRALVALMPEEDLGIVVLANRELSPLPIDVMYEVFDLHLGSVPQERVDARRAAMQANYDDWQLNVLPVRRWHAAALEHVNEGDPAEASWLIDQALARWKGQDDETTRSSLLTTRGRARGKLRDWTGADEDFTAAVEANPRDYFAWYARANLRSQQKRQAESLEDLTMVLRIAPWWSEALTMRGLFAIQEHDNVEALGYFSEAIYQNPRHPKAFELRGVVYQMQGNTDAALFDFGSAIRLDANAASAYSRRAQLLASKERNVEVVRDCDALIRLQPNNHEAYYLRGLSYAKLKRLDESVADFERAASLMADQNAAGSR